MKDCLMSFNKAFLKAFCDNHEKVKLINVENFSSSKQTKHCCPNRTSLHKVILITFPAQCELCFEFSHDASLYAHTHNAKCVCDGTHKEGRLAQSLSFCLHDVCARAPPIIYINFILIISHHERHAPVELLFQKNALFILCSRISAHINLLHIAFFIFG